MRKFVKKRFYTRQLLLQALYQWLLSQVSLEDLLQQFENKYLSNRADSQYFEICILNIMENIQKIDDTIKLFLDREIHVLDPIVMSVMRLSIYELIYQLDIPYRVVINEALELTKLFGASESYKYVNSVLDRAALQLRATEIRAGYIND